MKYFNFINYLLFIPFEPTKLQGVWHQVATNDPTIPIECKSHKLIWNLMPNKKEYEVEFNTIYNNTLDITIHLHGLIKNNKLYENFKPLPRIYNNNIVNIIEYNNIYNIVELIAEYNIFFFYKKQIYQLWSRKELNIYEIEKYINKAKKKYKINDIRIT